MEETKSNAPKKRGRKPSKKRKGYFYEEQEEAFLKYVTSKNQSERDRISEINFILPSLR